MKIATLFGALVVVFGVGACTNRTESVSQRASDESPAEAQIRVQREVLAESRAHTQDESAPTSSHLASDIAMSRVAVVPPAGVTNAQDIQFESSGTCPVVRLSASATQKSIGKDSTDTSPALSFAIPSTISVTAGSQKDFTAIFKYRATDARFSKGADCAYGPDGSSFKLIGCLPIDTFPPPKAGDTVSAISFELDVEPIIPLILKESVTAELDLGSVPSDDGNSCTIDACGAHGGATHTPEPTGFVCGTANACTTASTCNAAGSCVGGTPVNVDDGNPCTVDSCNASTGVTHTPEPAGFICGAATACDAASTCNATGSCIAGAPVSVDDGNACTIDACSASTGITHTPEPTGFVCGAATACTTASTCSATATCVAGSPVSVDDGNPCTVDSCSTSTGITHTPEPSGFVCGAATTCSNASMCNATGSCVAGTPVSVDDGNPCTTDACSASTGITHTPEAPGTICSAGNVCTGASTCNASAVCVAGTPPVIDDGNPCTTDACTPSTGVTHTPVAAGTTCNNNSCLTGETCNATGTCGGGSSIPVDDGNPCTADSCSPTTGVAHTPVAAGTSCSDGNACNGAETCSATATCLSGTPPTIDDGNPCTTDSCSPSTGVSHTPVSAGTSCSDGNACNGAETCNASAMCVAGTPPTIDDGNPCTADSCDPSSGVTHTPVAAGTSCSDGNACVSNETCNVTGTCGGGVAVSVDDGNPCTTDACSPSTGVTHTPVAAGTSCSDGNQCVTGETCSSGGGCGGGTTVPVDDGNPCTTDACNPATGVTHTPVATGTACGGNVCSGTSTCNAAGACNAGTPPNLSDGDNCTTDACTPASGITHTPIPGCGVPLVPTTVDPTVVYNFASATSFLFTGSNPVQINVAPGAIDPTRQAVVRGAVFDVNMNPIRGVQVSARGHAELGTTFTRDDGTFDFALNGGASVSLDIEAQGYLPVARMVNGAYNAFVSLDGVVMTALDPQVTEVISDAPTFQVVRGTTQTDADGTRTATILIPPNTTTSDLPMSTWHVRATEFTVGPTGQQAMPGLLPPMSAYTYAVGLTIDEADAAGVETVHFNQPVSFYVDNFIGIPAGAAVPLGFFDRTIGIWVPSADGVVLTILSTDGGIAHVDVTGDGVEDTGAALTAYGITDEERTQLAMTYAGAAGTSLWRLQVSHFSDYDPNFPYIAPAGAVACKAAPVASVPAEDNPTSGANACGSNIRCYTQDLGEEWPVAGTPLTLHYQSGAQAGNALRTFSLDLIDATEPVPPDLAAVKVVVSIAGTTTITVVPVTHIHDPFTFTWNGLDAYGRPAQGEQPAQILLRYTYPLVYASSGGGGGSGGGFGAGGVLPYTVSRIDIAAYFDVNLTEYLGAFDEKAIGLGGLTLSAHHVLSPLSGTLFYGDGSKTKFSKVLDVSQIAGGGSQVGGTNASTALLTAEGGVIGPDGAYYFGDRETSQVRRLAADGTISVVAGNGLTASSGDGGPALSAGMTPIALAFGPDGTLYILDNSALPRVRAVKNGIISAFAGTGVQADAGDGGPATQASFLSAFSIAVDPAGSVYVVDSYARKVRRVAPDGTISTFAGLGTASGTGDGGPAKTASLGTPVAIAFAADGTAYIADANSFSENVRRVDTSGMITTFAGQRFSGAPSGDGGPATSAVFNNLEGVAVDRGGNVFVLDKTLIRVIDASGTIQTLAGQFAATPSCAQDTNANLATFQFQLNGLTIAPDDSLYIGDYFCNAVRRIRPLTPSGSIPNGAGGVDTFNVSGRLLTTREERTGGLLYSFGYDANGHLQTLTDGDGLVTTINHDGAGNPTSIVAPFGQTTLLTVDVNGYVSSITDANGATASPTLDASGLMRSLVDVRGFTHLFNYDASGNLTFDQDPAGGSSTLSVVQGPNQKTITRTTAEGRAYTYDLQTLTNGDEQTTTTMPSGAQYRVTRDLQGQTSMSVNPDGTVTQTTATPDPIWQLIAPQGSRTTTTPAGLTRYVTTSRTTTLANPLDPFSVTSDVLTTSTNAGDCASGASCLHLTWTRTYTASNLQIVTASPLGRTTTTTIDSRGRPVQVAIPGVAPVTIHYDSAGRIDKTGHGTRVSTTSFDPTTGWAAQHADVLGRITNINARDGMGRLVSTTLPGNLTTLDAYDPAGNVTSITPPDESPTVLTYTPVDLEASLTPPAIAGASGVVSNFFNLDRQQTQGQRSDGSIFFAYDGYGRPSSTTEPTLAIAFGYDVADRLTSATSNELNLAMTYDGSLLRLQTFSGTVVGTVERQYDNLLRLNQLLTDGQSTAFSYDNDGLLIGAGPVQYTRDAQNGRVVGSAAKNVLDTWAYDAFGAVTHYDARDPSSMIVSFDYVRDALNRITQVTESDEAGVPVVTTYAYDTAGRLASVASGGNTTSYSYDSNGNRTALNGAPAATYDAQDRMLTYGANFYTYSAGGNLTSITAPSGTTNYTYDLGGSLRSATLPDGTALDYVVDAGHRRMGKKRDGILEQGFLYDGQLNTTAGRHVTGAEDRARRSCDGRAGIAATTSRGRA